MTDHAGVDGSSDLARLMADAWPGGVPAEEAALARSLPVARAAVAASRLAAVLSIELGGGVGDAAAGLRMDRIAFFRLRRRWIERRSLRSLVPFAGRSPRRVGAGRGEDAAIADALVATASRPLDVAWLAEALALRSGASMSRQTALRMIRQAADRASAGADEIARELGEEVLVDFAGTAMSVGGELVVVCLVVESATRFILGSAAGPLSSVQDLLGIATAAAAAVPGPPSDAVAALPGVRLRIVLPPSYPGFATDGLEAAVGRLGVRLVGGGERRFGQGLVALLGHRVGRMSLHPRALSAGVAPRRGIASSRHVNAADAAAFAAEAVRDHNEARCRLLLDSVAKKDAAVGAALSSAVTGASPERSFMELVREFPPWRPGAGRLAEALMRLEEARRLLQ